MKRLLTVILMLSVSVGIFSGCGPKQSSQDSVRDQLDQNNDKLSAIFKSLEGVYEGTFTFNDGESRKARLKLSATSKVVTNPGLSEPTITPSLIGTIFYSSKGDSNNYRNPVSFTDGYFNAKNEELVLSNTAESLLFDGTLKDGKIIGQVTEPDATNTVVLTRVNPPAKK